MDAEAIVELILEKIVETAPAADGEIATYNTRTAAQYMAYSSMSWPLVSDQIFSAQIFVIRCLAIYASPVNILAPFDRPPKRLLVPFCIGTES